MFDRKAVLSTRSALSVVLNDRSSRRTTDASPTTTRIHFQSAFCPSNCVFGDTHEKGLRKDWNGPGPPVGGSAARHQQSRWRCKQIAATSLGEIIARLDTATEIPWFLSLIPASRPLGIQRG